MTKEKIHMAKTLKCVILDFDLTLVDLHLDDQAIARAVGEAYARGGVARETVERYEEPFSMITEVYEELGRALPDEVAERVQGEALAAMASEEMKYVDKATVIPGAYQAVARLRAMGKRMGIVSLNSLSVMEALLSRFCFKPMVDLVVGRENPGRQKPHPDKVLRCLEEMGFKPWEALLVGDSERDVRAGKAAGLLTVGVLTGSYTRERLLAAGADHVIESIAELPALIEGLEAKAARD